MAATTDVLIPALEDAREAHAAVIDRFRTDVAFTRPGVDRQELQRQAAEAQSHLERIEDRVRAMRPRRGLLSAAGQFMQLATRAVVRAAMPLEVGAWALAERVRGQQPAHEHRLLKNTEDEYAAAARALATCQAGSDIAEQLHDPETADLLAVLRLQNEQLLEILKENLTRRARAAVTVGNDHRPPPAQADEGLLGAVMRTVREAVAQLRAHTVADTLRKTPAATPMAEEELQGAVTREEDLPIPRYSRLDIPEIQQCLPSLSQAELTVLDGYERAHAGRHRVLNAIARLREAEPWAGYDVMDPERIKIHLHDVSDSLVRQVLEYERRHRQRNTVINAAEGASPPTPEAED
ncbi:hypothetical protein [Streptomyces sp. NPDC001292]|uniref:hypothetical protein n=1 Tax=Streptomyces sp. NPDC001292 TaxID=3364558 RepID=UPI0036A7BA09